MKSFTAIAGGLCALLLFGVADASAQNWQHSMTSYALKSGESVETGDLYFISNCKSVLVGPIEVTILDGPPGVTAAAIPASVMARAQQCAKPVNGAKLVLTAGHIDDESNTLMTLRVRYPTKDGVREVSPSFMMRLFP